MSVNSDFNQIILENYTQKELRMLHALAEAMEFLYGPFAIRRGSRGHSL